MKDKRGLGLLVLRGFLKKTSHKKKKLKRTRSPDLKRPWPTLSLSKMQSLPPGDAEDSIEVVEEVSAQTSQITSLTVPVPAAQHPAEVKAPLGSFHGFEPPAQLLSTQDLVKPDDRLRQSIEAFLLDQRSPHTRRAYGKDLKRFVKFLLARNFQVGIEGLSRTILISYKESLLEEKLEHTTVDRHLATLRSFFKWLVDDGLISKSPAEGVRFLNPKRISRTNGFSDEEVRKILTLPDLHTRAGAMHYAILTVLFYCGLRRSELCELRTTHFSVERDQRVLRLRGKGNAERLIVLLPAVWSAVQYYFYITRRPFNEDSYLFIPIRNNRTGVVKKPLDTSMIYYIVTRYAKLAGISNRVSPHSCRATAISNARDHQVPDRAIQEFAGWASTDMITRYDKRKTSIQDSAAHSITYGAHDRPSIINKTTES